MLNDVVVTVNSVDLSDWVKSCSFNQSSSPLDTTAMGDSQITRIGGMLDGDVTIEFIQSFASSETYATLNPLLNTVTTVTMKATSGATAATNPLKSVSVVVSELPFVDGAVSDLSTISVSWPMASAVTTTTS